MTPAVKGVHDVYLTFSSDATCDLDWFVFSSQATLTPEQWNAPTLCDKWKVRDVVGHLVEGANKIPMGKMVGGMLKSGFNLNKMLAATFGAAFPAAYREDFAARAAVPDIQVVAKLSEAEPLGMSLYRPLEATPGTLRFKLYHLGAPVTLSDSLPMLEHMGLKVLDERPYRVTPEGSPPIWMHDLGMQSAIADTEVEIDALHAVFEEAFGRVFRGEVENDDFNRLVLAARLPAQEIVILRSYAKYLRQIGFPLSQAFIEATLASHAYIARVLIDLFKIRFDPDGIAGAGAKTADKVREIEVALEQVENLSEDRVLRQYLAMILATTRTNFWRRDAGGLRRSFV